MPSPQWLSSLLPFTRSVFCYLLDRGVPRVTFSTSSSQCLPRSRFVVFLYLPDAPRSWDMVISNCGCEQVIAPFLIILRVANRRALTSRAVSGGVSLIQFSNEGKSTGGSRTLPGGSTASSVDLYGKTPGEFSVTVETTIDLHLDSV
jgi:hypothetical protein